MTFVAINLDFLIVFAAFASLTVKRLLSGPSGNASLDRRKPLEAQQGVAQSSMIVAILDPGNPEGPRGPKPQLKPYESPRVVPPQRGDYTGLPPSMTDVELLRRLLRVTNSVEEKTVCVSFVGSNQIKDLFVRFFLQWAMFMSLTFCDVKVHG